MTSEIQLRLLVLFVVLFSLGSLTCLPLYHWNLKQFLASRLWVKIYWWWPIFAVFCAVAWLPWLTWPVVAALVLQASREYRRFGQKSATARVYLLIYSAALTCLPLITVLATDDTTMAGTLITICFASALSDVCAFFFGNYLGRHHLPQTLNDHKAWEGVAGQIVGGLVGGLVLGFALNIDISLLLAVLVGTASAIGDLSNSFVKRRLDIKDWGDTIPGHGGVLDRFSSLSLAFSVGLMYILLNH